MLKLTRDKQGHIIIESLNGKKLKIHEYEKGFKFNSKWWPRDDANSMFTEIQQVLGHH